MQNKFSHVASRLISIPLFRVFDQQRSQVETKTLQRE